MHEDRESEDFSAEAYDHGYDHDAGSGLFGTTLRNISILLALSLGLIWISGGFSPDAPTTSSALVKPAKKTQSQQLDDRAFSFGEVLVPPEPSGHFLLNIGVNGIPVRFLVDTGATMVVLSTEDARKVGLPVQALDYNKTFQTANGPASFAMVTLRDMQLGDGEIRDVAAAVAQADMGISLLGMSFLNRLSGYEVRPDGLVLRF